MGWLHQVFGAAIAVHASYFLFSRELFGGCLRAIDAAARGFWGNEACVFCGGEGRAVFKPRNEFGLPESCNVA